MRTRTEGLRHGAAPTLLVGPLVVGGAETQLSYLDITRLGTDAGFATAWDALSRRLRYGAD